jgi:hypothetical protein
METRGRVPTVDNLVLDIAIVSERSAQTTDAQANSLLNSNSGTKVVYVRICEGLGRVTALAYSENPE